MIVSNTLVNTLLEDTPCELAFEVVKTDAKGESGTARSIAPSYEVPSGKWGERASATFGYSLIRLDEKMRDT